MQPARFGALAAALVLTAACAGNSSVGPGADSNANRVALLQRDLRTLTKDGDGSESRRLAEAAIAFSKSLAGEYRLVRPPILHNLLVNVGLKNRGLCYHWTQDMLERLGALSLRRYQLHWGVARRGKLFREHNSVIVTARGQDFESGIVLDPWRHSGELFWVSVREDSYPWEPF